MNSTHPKDKNRPKLASVSGKFYIRSCTTRRKNQPVVEEKRKDEVIEKPVRTYDEGYLFHLFCCVDGRMPELFKMINTFSPAEQAKIPKPSTLYKIANENDWRMRFEEIRSKMREDFENRNGLPYTKIDQLASYLLRGTMMKFVSALKEENYKDFQVKDLKSLWHMSRTERGLAPTVPFKDQNQEKYSDQVTHIQNKYKNQDSGAGPEFYERLGQLSSEELKVAEYLFTGERHSEDEDDDDIPSIIRKK